VDGIAAIKSCEFGVTQTRQRYTLPSVPGSMMKVANPRPPGSLWFIQYECWHANKKYLPPDARKRAQRQVA